MKTHNKNFCFTVDDNIRFLKEATQHDYKSIFDHPYMRVYKRLHEKYALKIQLNLFYEMDEFDLSFASDRYRDEWLCCSDWLKLSFHSKKEIARPYVFSDYAEVFEDCKKVHEQIVRFASEPSLAKTTTLHYCLATDQGLRALEENGIRGLLGLYGTDEQPRTSYQNTPEESAALRRGKLVRSKNMTYGGIDIVLNAHSKQEILRKLEELNGRELIKVMIHEQYFYPDYQNYQPKFEEKLDATFNFLAQNGYASVFLEELL